MSFSAEVMASAISDLKKFSKIPIAIHKLYEELKMKTPVRENRKYP
jgi:hypothetical protein